MVLMALRQQRLAGQLTLVTKQVVQQLDALPIAINVLNIELTNSQLIVFINQFIVFANPSNHKRTLKANCSIFLISAMGAIG